MTNTALARLAQEAGFTAWADLDVATIDCNQEVRAMCAGNSCGMYGKCWSCPPACGTPAQCAARVKAHSRGILVQTVGDLADSFDFEAMAEIEASHKTHVDRMLTVLREATESVLALGAGCCTRCAECTCPDAPCRFPDKMVSSMEAYGILVSQVCKSNGLEYHYGPNKMAYTSCFLTKS